MQAQNIDDVKVSPEELQDVHICHYYLCEAILKTVRETSETTGDRFGLSEDETVGCLFPFAKVIEEEVVCCYKFLGDLPGIPYYEIMEGPEGIEDIIHEHYHMHEGLSLGEPEINDTVKKRIATVVRSWAGIKETNQPKLVDNWSEITKKERIRVYGDHMMIDLNNLYPEDDFLSTMLGDWLNLYSDGHTTTSYVVDVVTHLGIDGTVDYGIAPTDKDHHLDLLVSMAHKVNATNIFFNVGF